MLPVRLLSGPAVEARLVRGVARHSTRRIYHFLEMLSSGVSSGSQRFGAPVGSWEREGELWLRITSGRWAGHTGLPEAVYHWTRSSTRLRGESPEGIAESFPALDLEQVYGAIAFYLGHRDTIDAYLRAGAACLCASEIRPARIIHRCMRRL